jgi:hypothetical protein
MIRESYLAACRSRAEGAPSNAHHRFSRGFGEDLWGEKVQSGEWALASEMARQAISYATF